MESSETKRKPLRVGNTKLSYIAGLLDGEGCFVSNYSSCSRRYPSIRVEITQSRRDLLEWIQSLLGGKILMKHMGVGISKHPCYCWCPSDTKTFMKLMKPFVLLKRPQLEVTLAFYSLPYGSTEKKRSLAEKLTRLNKEFYTSEDIVQPYGNVRD